MYLQPAPFALRNQVGRAENYFLHAGYECRMENEAFDDTPFTDEFQKEVYEYARQISHADQGAQPGVLDIGCGSGFKLMKYFSDCITIGIDVPKTVEFLKDKYPRRVWLTVSEQKELLAGKTPDLVICADVIEHLRDPHLLLDFIGRLKGALLVLSTPERDELCLGTHHGPPKNIHHVREWNFAELHAYISSRFQIKEHFVINGTQIVECQL